MTEHYAAIRKLLLVQDSNCRSPILDASCGTAEMTIHLLRNMLTASPDDAKVVFLNDLSKGMLRAAVANLRKSAPGYAIHLSQYNMADFSILPDESVRTVFCSQTLHVVDSVTRELAIREFFRLLMPEGSLYLVEEFPHQVKCGGRLTEVDLLMRTDLGYNSVSSRKQVIALALNTGFLFKEITNTPIPEKDDPKKSTHDMFKLAFTKPLTPIHISSISGSASTVV